MSQTEMMKGTTTLGLVCSDGVILATEKRATAGHLIAHKTTQKLFRIDDHMGLTVAGLVGDAQLLARWLQAEAELYHLKRGQPLSIKAASTLMANILNGRRMMPFWVQLLVGGTDADGGHVYSLDAAGGAIPVEFVTTGSGSPLVYGVLEDHFVSGLSLKEGAQLAIRALTAAMKRDSASGDGISLAAISKKGYQKYSDEEINQEKEAMGLD